MELTNLDKQIIFWSRAAIVLPVVTTLVLTIVYFLALIDIETLFFIAAGLYLITAAVWWWWTMTKIIYLYKKINKTSFDIYNISKEVSSIKQNIFTDNVDSGL